MIFIHQKQPKGAMIPRLLKVVQLSYTNDNINAEESQI